MRPLGLSANTLAKAIDVPVTRVSEILRGRRGVTADTALRLARFLGTTPELWLVLQATYDLQVAYREAGDSIETRVIPLNASEPGTDRSLFRRAPGTSDLYGSPVAPRVPRSQAIGSAASHGVEKAGARPQHERTGSTSETRKGFEGAGQRLLEDRQGRPRTVIAAPNSPAIDSNVSVTIVPGVQILEYLDVRGRSPYATWFADLNATAAAKVAAALFRLQEGNFPLVKGSVPGFSNR